MHDLFEHETDLKPIVNKVLPSFFLFLFDLILYVPSTIFQ